MILAMIIIVGMIIMMIMIIIVKIKIIILRKIILIITRFCAASTCSPLLFCQLSTLRFELSSFL